jgi:hypothetical protein
MQAGADPFAASLVRVGVATLCITLPLQLRAKTGEPPAPGARAGAALVVAGMALIFLR